MVLMGVERRADIAAQLLEGGLAPETPIAAVESASMAAQRVQRARLDQLGRLEVRAPAVLVIGAVAALELGRVLEAAGLASA